MLSAEEKDLLDRLLAKATAAYSDYTSNETDVLILLGMGMFWSKEIDVAVRQLADKIAEEFRHHDDF